MPMFSKPMIFQKNQLVWKRSFTLSNVASTTSEFQKNQLVWKFRSFSLLYSSSFSAFQKNQLVWKISSSVPFTSVVLFISEKLVSMEEYHHHLQKAFPYQYFRKTSQYGSFLLYFLGMVLMNTISEKLVSMEDISFSNQVILTQYYYFRKTSQYGSGGKPSNKAIFSLSMNFRKTSQYGRIL